MNERCIALLGRRDEPTDAVEEYCSYLGAALAWSRRGFPLRFLRILRILRASGARVAVVFHDVEPYTGHRFVDRLRRSVQLRAMREALRLADVAVLTVPAEKLSGVR